MAEQEGSYDAYVNEKGEILFAINAREAEPEEPHLMYDGKEHALFLRRKGGSVLLDFIHPEVQMALAKVDQVVIVESTPEDIVREYYVPVRHVSTLPVKANLPSDSAAKE